MESKCPYCNGIKHVLVKAKDGSERLVRCRCLIKEEIRNKVESFNLSFDIIDYLVDEQGFRFSEDKDGQAAAKFYSVYKQGRSANKLIVLNCALSIMRVKSILSMLCAKAPKQDFQYKDITDFINDSFNNERTKLKKITIVTTLFSTSKQLKSKFIQDLHLQAQLENKLLILVVDDFQALKQDLPDLAILFSKVNTLILPEI